MCNEPFSYCKIKLKKRIYFERLCLRYHPSEQEITCSKLATETQEYGMKTVQD